MGITDVDTLPKTKECKVISVPPGKAMTMTVKYSAEGQGAQVDVSVYASGKRVTLMNSYVPGPRTWTSPINPTEQNSEYTVLSWWAQQYKDSHGWDISKMDDRGNFAGACHSHLHFIPYQYPEFLIFEEEKELWPRYLADVLINII
jgi:hypothetical protein